MKALPKENGPNAPFANEIIDLLNMLNLRKGSTLFRLIATHAWIKGAEKANSKKQAEIEALHNLVKEQNMKIINLSFDLTYANRTIELANKESEE